MEPTMENLAKMDLVASEDENTEAVSVRDEERRKFYYTQFHHGTRNKKFKNAIWGIEYGAKGNIKCNGNVVLMQVGATIPAVTGRAEKDVEPIYILPTKTLGAWSIDHLRSVPSEYKGEDRIALSEPSKRPVPRFYDYLPKPILDMKEETTKKFVQEFKAKNVGLTVEHVKISYILMRCNLAMDNRADVEEHTWFTHGMEMSQVKREVKIKVNEAETLELTAAMNFKELSKQGRLEVYDSWFALCVATATVTNDENKDNCKIQKHKAGQFLKSLKNAITPEMYQNVYFQLQRTLKEGDNLLLGFQCKWSEFENAMEEALGPMSKVRRFKSFLNSKDHLKGGVSLANMFYRCITLVEDAFGKTDVYTTHSDKKKR